MHVVRVLAALVFGGLASIALAHLLADAFRPIWGEQAPVRAVFGAPVVILFTAWVIVLLTRPVQRANSRDPSATTVHLEVTVNVARAEALRDFSGVSCRDMAECREVRTRAGEYGVADLKPGMLFIQPGTELRG